MKWLLVSVLIAANASGDLLNAAGMRRHGEVNDFRPSGMARLLLSLMRNCLVIAGVAMMCIAFFAQMSLLSIADVSFAVPATASGYILETILAKLLLGEHIGAVRWTGAALVGIGVALLEF
jgi:drug/metabolite transporter (DMT)-like permease